MELQEFYQLIQYRKNELDHLLPMKQEWQEKLNKKFRLEWNYNSNHIEGNTLTYGETELLLIFGKTTGDHDIREYDEMKAHDVAVSMIQDYAKDPDRSLNETFIKDLNQTILVKPFWKQAITPDGQPTRRLIEIGQYKRQPNSVRLENGEMFNYASPEEVPAKMGDLMEFYRVNDASTEVNKVWLAAMIHYEFVRIHPFDDGNGRTSRLLMNYILIKNGLPPVIIKSADKKRYLDALNKADVGNKEAFVQFICEELIWSLDKSISAATGLSIEDDDDLKKEISLLKRNILGGSAAVVPVNKSKENVEKLFISTFVPLAKELVDFTREINDIFYSTEYSHNLGKSTELDKTFEDLNKLLAPPYDLLGNEQLRFQISWEGLRKGTFHSSQNNIGLFIDLKQTFYTIRVHTTVQGSFKMPLTTNREYEHVPTREELITIIKAGVTELVKNLARFNNT